VQKAKGAGQVAALQVANSEIRHTFVVAALIRREDEILLIRQQGHNDVAPYWAIPGGVVDANESLEIALAREVQEECGLIVQTVGPLAYLAWIEHSPTQRTTALIYEIEAWTGDFAFADPDGLVHEATFFALDAAVTQLTALPYRSMREPLLAYLRGESVAGRAWVFRSEEDDPFVVPPGEATRWQSVQALVDVNSERASAAVHALETSALLEILADFTPTLIGTIPLGIETQRSDLDVACFAPNLADFAQKVHVLYAAMPKFFQKEKKVRGVPSVIAGFTCAGVDVQIFAQPQPVLVQYGYRHLVVEGRLLARGGADAVQEIRRRKASGTKTEPAFAELFGLNGDAYEVLWWLSFVVAPS